ncbi:MAG: GMC family oxidoreductase [Deltaproteobacteria bacterium]|nr:GMC family oxidoreductase [Deltaproteobacteria bacterium]
MSRFQLLSRRRGRILEALARSLITEEVLKKVSLEQAHFRERILFSLTHCSPQLRWSIFFALWILEWEPLLFRFRPFTGLSAAKRDRYVKKWGAGHSYIRYLLFRPLHAFIYAAYYSNHEISAKLGFVEPYDGRDVIREAGDAEGRAPDRAAGGDVAYATSRHDISNRASHSDAEDERETRRRQDPRRFGILDVPERDTEINVEVCVIGSGAGGAVAAKELAEKGHEVLILEEGGPFSLEHFKNLSTMERNTLIYRDGGMTTTIGVPMVLLPTGKGVGGTTIINSGTCFRTPKKVFDRWWNDFGLDLTPELMNPFFEKVESTLGVAPVADPVLGGNDRVLQGAAKKLGLHGGPLQRNAPDCQGSGVCIFGCPTGAKQSMERSYLPLAFKAGARLYPFCRVERLHRRPGRVYRIDARFFDPQTGQPRSRLIVYPQKTVVACGTLHSPLLLKRSRIGLQSGQLGKNLTIHPTAKMVGIFDEVIDGHRGVPQASQIADYEEEGMMFESVFFPPWLLATSIFQVQEKHAEIMRAYRRVGVYGFLVHDENRGRVVSGPGGRPIVFYNLGHREKELFVKGLKILARLFFSAGARKVYPTVRTIHEISSVEEMEKVESRQIRRRDLESAAFHPLGTCRMGMDPKRSVVDENLRVHGVENLWVADGSVFPTSLGVNPQITIMAFATRCAEGIHSA